MRLKRPERVAESAFTKALIEHIPVLHLCSVVTDEPVVSSRFSCRRRLIDVGFVGIVRGPLRSLLKLGPPLEHDKRDTADAKQPHPYVVNKSPGGRPTGG